MKKVICILGCAIALILAGCQTQFALPNSTPDSGQIDIEDNLGTDRPAGDAFASDPTRSESSRGKNSSNENDSFASVTLSREECELKKEGSLRGEIEVIHKLTCGKMTLSEGDTALFHLETPSDSAELKITLIGVETGKTLEASVTGAGDVSFEVNKADEYIVLLENCSLSGVKFTIDYSFGGSK